MTKKKAAIIMVNEDGQEYSYGDAYDYETPEEKEHAVEVALQVEKERDMYTYVRPVGAR